MANHCPRRFNPLQFRKALDGTLSPSFAPVKVISVANLAVTELGVILRAVRPRQCGGATVR